MAAGGPSQHSYVGGPVGAAQTYPPQSFDTTGQIAPTGMKPRVTATLWEDEGCMCFQVEAKGVCVARRDGTAPLACIYAYARLYTSFMAIGLKTLTNHICRQSHD